jgi:hypothetical protein
LKVLIGKNFKLISTATIFLTLLASFCVPQIPSVASVDEYTYYGAIPSKIYQYVDVDTSNLSRGYGLDALTVRTRVLIAITATKNDTHVRVYSLNNGSLVSEVNLDAMKKHFAFFPNASIFKVVTDKYASVMLLSYQEIPVPSPDALGPVPTTFHAGTDGVYVGKEFIFMASWNARSNSWQSYRIFALEKADVTVTREDGIREDYSLEINSFKDLSLSTFMSYRVESTGNIMVESKGRQARGDPRRYYFVPSAEGGFVGKIFYATSTTDWDAEEDYGFRVSTAQDTTVTIWNLQTKEELMEFAVKGGEGVGVMPKADAILVQSIEPVTLAYVHNGSLLRTIYPGRAYGSGIAYIGVKPNEETVFFLPTNSTCEAYVFADERAAVTLDDAPVTIEAGSYHLITTAGTHRIMSDTNVVVEVIHWPLNPPYQGLNFEGVEIPCVQTVGVVPDVTLTPLGEALPFTYIVIAGAAGVAAAIIGLFLMKHRRK